MSHVVSVDLIIKDLDVLREVADSIGLELVEATTYNWYSTWVRDYHKEDAAYKHGIKPEDYGKCDGWKLKIKGGSSSDYEIGLHKTAGDEGFTLVYDFYGSGRKLKEILGEQGEHLKQNYALRVAEKSLKKKDMRAVGEPELLPDGRMRLVMKRGMA
jgi:hypothetical protein